MQSVTPLLSGSECAMLIFSSATEPFLGQKRLDLIIVMLDGTNSQNSLAFF